MEGRNRRVSLLIQLCRFRLDVGAAVGYPQAGSSNKFLSQSVNCVASVPVISKSPVPIAAPIRLGSLLAASQA